MPIGGKPQSRPTSGYGSRKETTMKNKNNSRSTSPSKTTQKRQYKTCCGGRHIPEEEREAVLQGTNSKSFPGSQSCEEGPTHEDLLNDVVAVNSPRQDGGLFQMLLDNDGAAAVDNGGHVNGGGQFSGVESTFTDAPDEPPPPATPPPKNAPNSPPKSPGRRSKRPKICEDPFAKLPPILQNPPMMITQHNKEERKVFHRRAIRKGASGKFAQPLYPNEPFKQLAHVIFKSADMDKDNRLSKREFASILNAPSLELDLLKDDIKIMEKECCQDREDIKKVPISFDEFLPLAECLLPLYYSKLDTESKNAWCVLDRDELGHLYLNKHTGELSCDRPDGFNEDKELFLFEEALHELFEVADMNKDGMIKLQDFLRIINSADFGLCLTNRDVKELTKQFLNEAGKVSNVCYSEFIPLAKRLIMIVYRARASSPCEWNHLYTCQVGSFWFNKRTGQTQRFAPNSYVRMQQISLQYREHEQKIFAETAEELHETKENLKQEMALREDFEQKFNDLTENHDKLTKTHATTVTILDKTKIENEKRQKQIDKLEKEQIKLQQKVKYLEQRVSAMERTEANLENLREVLRTTQTTVRERDYDINEIKEKLGITSKQLKDEQNKCEELNYKIDDLHQQLRDEIKRNEIAEKELEKIPNLQKETDAALEKMRQTKAAIDEKKAHLILARATHRDDKEKIQTMEKELSRLPSTEQELELAKCEVYTLKQLLVGKDSLVMKKSQEVENFKEILDEDGNGRGRRGMVARGKNNGAVKVMKMDSSSPVLRRPPSRQDVWGCVNTSSSSGPPSTVSNGSRTPRVKSSTRRSRLDVSTPPNGTIPDSRVAFADDNKSSESPPLSSMNTNNGGFLKLVYNNGNAEDMPTLYDLYTPDGSYAPVGKKAHTPSIKNGSVHSSSSSDKLDESESSNKVRAGTLMFEDDFMAAQFIHVGDRVRLRKPGARPGSCKTSDILTGIVKFVGKIDKEKTDHRLFVGLKLDDPVGDTDGVINGKKYFSANIRHGKLLRIHDILSVLNPKSASYKRVSDLIREQRLETGTLRYDKNKPQLIRVI